jgi:hypothetical protein
MAYTYISYHITSHHIVRCPKSIPVHFTRVNTLYASKLKRADEYNNELFISKRSLTNNLPAPGTRSSEIT